MSWIKVIKINIAVLLIIILLVILSYEVYSRINNPTPYNYNENLGWELKKNFEYNFSNS